MKLRSPFLSTFTVVVLLIVSAGAATGARPPSDDDPTAGGALYGDLYVLERDGNGEPILFTFEYTDPHTGLLEEAEARFGNLEDLPFSEIIREVAAYQVRKRSRRRR